MEYHNFALVNVALVNAIRYKGITGAIEIT